MVVSEGPTFAKIVLGKCKNRARGGKFAGLFLDNSGCRFESFKGKREE